jgi:hypothetical protein
MVPWATLEAMCGTWSTDPEAPGDGLCPRDTPVQFHETLVVTRAAPTDSWLTVVQRAVDAGTGATLHAEHGFLRPHGAGVELALAMNSGRLEVGRGGVTADGGVVRLVVTSEAFLNDRLQVIAMRRTLEFDLGAGTCDKQLELATGLGWPSLTRHMWARLLRA